MAHDEQALKRTYKIFFSINNTDIWRIHQLNDDSHVDDAAAKAFTTLPYSRKRTAGTI